MDFKDLTQAFTGLSESNLQFVCACIKVSISSTAAEGPSPNKAAVRTPSNHRNLLMLNRGGDSPPGVTLPTSGLAHDQQTVLRWIGTDEPMTNQRYRITTEDGRTFECCTDASGLAERFTSAIPFGRYSIEALDD